MIFLGIDIGLSGAVAAIDDRGVLVIDTPTTVIGTRGKNKREYLLGSMVQAIQNITKGDFNSVRAVLELVHSMPKQGLSSTFTFGRGLGLWEGILSALNISFSKVAPQTWKKTILADMGKDKDASRVRAMQLYPTISSQLSRKKDDGRAEAILLAHYCAMQYAVGINR